MTSPLTTTRAMVIAECEAAKLVADQRGALHGTPGALAGLYLELAGGDAQVAAIMVPVGGLFFERVREALLSIHREERAAGVAPPSNVVSFAQAAGRVRRR